jgi:flagellar basal-body rod modification protein FlgD
MFLENVNGVRFLNETPKDDAKPKKEMNKDDFLNLLVTQLKYQDPTDPIDNDQFISQTTQFSSLEQLINVSKGLESLNKLVESLTTNNQLLTASGFIGKEVRYLGNYTSLKNGKAEISFQVDNKPSKVDISIIDGKGSVIAKLSSSDAVSGKNKVIWDGFNIEGKAVPEGIYAFQVDAYNDAGSPIAVNTYTTGLVNGVVNESGSLKFNVYGNMVAMDQILSVNEARE